MVSTSFVSDLPPKTVQGSNVHDVKVTDVNTVIEDFSSRP